jgi:hypothetical protein
MWSSLHSALTSALRHKHRIDDVNDAILLVDVGNRYEGLIAFRVDDFESPAVLPHGQLFTLDGFVGGLAPPPFLTAATKSAAEILPGMTW